MYPLRSHCPKNEDKKIFKTRPPYLICPLEGKMYLHPSNFPENNEKRKTFKIRLHQLTLSALLGMGIPCIHTAIIAIKAQ